MVRYLASVKYSIYMHAIHVRYLGYMYKQYDRLVLGSMTRSIVVDLRLSVES